MKAAVVLVATIAIAAAAGTAVSLAQRPPSPPPTRSPVVDTALPSNQPAVAFGFAVASDLASHTLVLFGGVDDFDTTWLWNGAFWVRAHPATSPPGRYGASEAFDPLNGEVLLFGGTLQTGQAANDTWAWDGSTWQERDTGRGGPWGGAGSDMAWDPTLNEMVLVTLPPGGRGRRPDVALEWSALGSGGRRGPWDELLGQCDRLRPAVELADGRGMLPGATHDAVHVALERANLEPAQNVRAPSRRIEHGGGPVTPTSRPVWLRPRRGIEPGDVGLERPRLDGRLVPAPPGRASGGDHRRR